MEINLIKYKIWPGLEEAVCTDPQACRRVFFLILVLGKLKTVMLELIYIAQIFNLQFLF